MRLYNCARGERHGSDRRSSPGLHHRQHHRPRKPAAGPRLDRELLPTEVPLEKVSEINRVAAPTPAAAKGVEGVEVRKKRRKGRRRFLAFMRKQDRASHPIPSFARRSDLVSQEVGVVSTAITQRQLAPSGHGVYGTNGPLSDHVNRID